MQTNMKENEFLLGKRSNEHGSLKHVEEKDIRMFYYSHRSNILVHETILTYLF